MIGEKWGKVPLAEKEAAKVKAQKELAAHKVEMEAYKLAHPEGTAAPAAPAAKAAPKVSQTYWSAF